MTTLTLTLPNADTTPHPGPKWLRSAIGVLAYCLKHLPIVGYARRTLAASRFGL